MRRRMLGLIRRISGLGLDAKAIRGLLESAPNLVGVAIEERIAFANGASSRLLGVRREDLVGRSVFDFVHPADRESARAALARARAEHEVAPLQVRLIALDGTTLDVEAYLAAIHFRGRDAVLFHGRDRSARRRSETARRESEARYRLLAESSYDVVSEYTASGQLLYVSPSIERVLGYTPDEWQREHATRVLDFLHPDDVAHARELLASGEMPETVEVLQRFRHRDGSYRWVHTRGRRFETAGGERHVVMTSRDVTEEQRALAALRESERRYQTLASAVPVGIFRIDDKGRHLYVNERWAELTGISVEAAMADPGSRPLHPEDAGKILELSRRALAEGRPLRLEQRIVRPDGEVRWVLNQALPELDANGAFAGWVGTLTDLSARKASALALSESEARLRLALEAAEMCTWEWEPSRGRVGWSPNAARVFGLSEGESIPTTTAEAAKLVHPDDVEAARKLARGRAHQGEPFELEFRLAPRPGQETRWILMRGQAVPGDDRAIGVVADVTARRRLAEERAALEARLHESQRLESLGLLAGGVAHDFNNLLVGILGNADLALQRPIADPNLLECLQEIQRAGDRAAGLVRQIVAFAGRERVELDRVDVRAVVDDTLRLLRASLPERAKLDWCPPEPIFIDCDSTQLRQVLMNLVTNACEALPPEGGLVTLRVTPIDSGDGDGREVAIEVSDTGCGIGSGAAAQMFDPFFTTKGAGRGLGLAVAHGIVRAHRGRVYVESSVGHGTRIRVLLPASARERASAPPRASARDEPRPRGRGTILVVDDERGVREVARRALEAAGYSVLLAGDRREALAQVRDHAGSISAIVLDLTLGSESGEAMLGALRELAGATPVLATSGYAADPALERLAAQGVAGFVQKPFTATGLASSVATALQARSAS
jgi:two-component system, cell cycle sensor histidine kinase and response regulator CckA